MTAAPTLTTPRLLLRPWRDADFAPFAALNADPRVMEHMPRLLTRKQSDQRAAAITDHFARHGFGAWAVEVRGTSHLISKEAGMSPLCPDSFIGFVGLTIPSFQAHFTPCVEIGWRLAFEHWGKGYATEAARAVLALAFGDSNKGDNSNKGDIPPYFLSNKGDIPSYFLKSGMSPLFPLDEVVSFTTTSNDRSRRVMQRLGMTHNPADDFDHPKLPEGHALRRHVLYRLSQS